MDDNSDEIERCQNVGRHELVPTVKSKAVMKFSPVQVPANFNRLEFNTNLNLPPSNWLTSSNSTHGLHQALYQSAGFASFRLGQMFPDCVGEVDVVSDAENIKKLLKLPYTSKGAISMIVHKVGNTLLLDEFDIQKYLLRKADDDWKWLRTFILEHILAYGEKERNYCIKDKSREALQSKNLLSKFLYYSLKQSSADDASMNLSSELLNNKPTASGASLSSPVLPEAKEDVYVPDAKSSHAFNRNVVWTFEDIRMLIGTNFPIFGGKNRPCVSLRLRDMTKPINVLTGIDYWLDNLMCNVPEVVMCYHLDGIVQKYEIIKTEDLPYLEDSEFSPQVVRNVAQNILAFLKANATKAGHTYWLFKGHNDDVVKLYDLSTLCKNQKEGDDESEKPSNPFTVPVGMLLYTVARNMKKTLQHVTPKAAGNIRALLDNCIKLLPKEKYPQIVTSSHYILSDLHIPAGIDPQAPKFDEVDSDEQSIYDDDNDVEDEEDAEEKELGCGTNMCYQNGRQDVEKANVAIQHICETVKEFKPNGKQFQPSPLIANTLERCTIALRHINEGLSCLQYFDSNEEDQFLKESEARAKDEEKERILHEEQNPNMAKPYNPIPLPYQTLGSKGENSACDTKQKKVKLKRNKIKELQVVTKATPNNQQFSANFNNHHFGSWNVHLKLLLLEKASLTYAILAEYHYDKNDFGASLSAIYKSYRCQQVVSKYMSNMMTQQSCLMGRAGDCFYKISENWHDIDDYILQFDTIDEANNMIIMELEKELENDEPEVDLITPVKNFEHIMMSSCKCYEQALKLNTNTESNEATNELLRRLGSVRNELGLKYMYWAQEEYGNLLASKTPEMTKAETILKSKGTMPLYSQLIMKSYDSLQRGIEIFTIVQDKINLAFLYCNMSRFLRLRAHIAMPNEKEPTFDKVKLFYNEAFVYYGKAKNVLDTRKTNEEMWDMVNWELSTATFSLAKQMQDFSSIENYNYTEISKEVVELLQKALKLCDTDHNGSRQILYGYRSAIIHKRIASLYHSQLRASYRDIGNIPKRTLQLCKYHYEKSARMLEELRETTDYLEVQLERISIHEFLAELSPHIAQKIKQYQTVLELCEQTEKLFEYAIQSVSATTPCTNTPVNNEVFNKHLTWFESRLQNALKTLIKLLLTGKDPKKLAEIYKKMYMETLIGKRELGVQQVSDDEQTKLQHLLNILKRLKHISATLVDVC